MDDEDPFALRGDETPDEAAILKALSACTDLDSRRKRYMYKLCDVVYLPAIAHLNEDDEWDKHMERVLSRMPIPSDRSERCPWSYWNRLSRVAVCPDPTRWDPEYHYGAMARVSRACWTTRELQRLLPAIITRPTDGINHPHLGAAGGKRPSMTRYINIMDAWEKQRDNKYACVPDADFLPPPSDRMPVGTYEQGQQDGQKAGELLGEQDALAGTMERLNSAPPSEREDGRRYSLHYLEGWVEAYRQSYMQAHDAKEGAIGGEKAGRKRGEQDGLLGLELPSSEMWPELVGIKGRSKRFRDEWHEAFMRAYYQALAEHGLDDPPDDDPPDDDPPDDPPTGIDRKALYRALSKALAYLDAGNDEEARQWREELDRLLDDLGL